MGHNDGQDENKGNRKKKFSFHHFSLVDRFSPFILPYYNNDMPVENQIKYFSMNISLFLSKLFSLCLEMKKGGFSIREGRNEEI
jgi:hypothetical protein